MKDVFRDRPRFLLRRPGLWKPSEGSASAVAILDLSLTGARLRLGANEGALAGPQSTGELLLPMLPELTPLAIPSSVVWKEGVLRGLEFRALDARTQKILRSFVEFHLNA